MCRHDDALLSRPFELVAFLVGVSTTCSFFIFQLVQCGGHFSSPTRSDEVRAALASVATMNYAQSRRHRSYDYGLKRIFQRRDCERGVVAAELLTYWCISINSFCSSWVFVAHVVVNDSNCGVLRGTLSGPRPELALIIMCALRSPRCLEQSKWDTLSRSRDARFFCEVLANCGFEPYSHSRGTSEDANASHIYISPSL